MENEKILQILDDTGNALEALGVRIRHAVAEVEGVTGPAPAAMKEEIFMGLTWEGQQGAQIGAYEVAYKANNLPDKWTPAHEFLDKARATINARYHGEGYVFSYWLFHDNKIYRQKLKKA
jgi:hypothetical protein